MSIYKYDSTQDELIPLAGGTLYADAPIGSIFAYGGSNPVDGFLLCQGQAVSRTTYAELFAVIGTSFGSGDGSTTFNIPDMRESVPKGAGLTGHTVGAHIDADGLAVGEFLDDRVQNITGKLSRSGIIGAGGAFYGSGSNYNANLSSGSIDGSKYDIYFDASRIVRAGNTTEVKAVGVNYIIKATQVGVPADFAPVDVVENGNMKAVTSNAVYDYVANVETITPVAVTGGAAGTVITWGSFDVKKIGKIVTININNMKHTNDVDVPGGIIIATGLPKPITGRFYLVGLQSVGAYIDGSGNLGIDAGFMLSTNYLYGSCTYICAE